MFLVMTSVGVWFSQHHTVCQLLLTCGTKGHVARYVIISANLICWCPPNTLHEVTGKS